MSSKDFIEQLSKELKVELELKPNSNYPSMTSVWYKGAQICSIPSGEINVEHNPGYTNEAGYAHRNIPTAKALIVSFLDKWEHEAGFQELMTETI